MTKDVEMKEAETVGANPTSTEEKVVEEATSNPRQVLKACVGLLTRAVRVKDARVLPGRALRQVAGMRKQMTSADILAVTRDSLDPTAPLFSLVTAAMEAEASRDGSAAASTPGAGGDVDMAEAPADAKAKSPAPPSVLPEVEVFLSLLSLLRLSDAGRTSEMLPLAEATVERVTALNRRSLDILGARVLFYWSWAHERLGTLASIRSRLLALHRTATLRHDEIGQETLMNLLLRNYLLHKQYDQAERFRSQAQHQEPTRSSQQLCRYLHYLGRIRAIQLDYTGARDALQQALRKSPAVAKGFRATTLKWLTLVRLLMGEVPDRAELTQPQTMTAMAPYLALTQAVRRGDLKDFQRVAEQHAAAFATDGTANLIVRLRNNVIRAGLRRISLAYSRISLADVASRLGLEGSQRDIECVVAKAIRDGAVDVTLDHEAGCLVSNEVLDIYSSYEPQHAFHARVAFCLDIHNDAMRAMRFEPAKKQAQAKPVLMTDEELAEAMEEEEDEF